MLGDVDQDSITAHSMSGGGGGCRLHPFEHVTEYLPSPVERARLAGRQGKGEFREGRHACMFAGRVSLTSFPTDAHLNGG
jgi:hypothetical protein